MRSEFQYFMSDDDHSRFDEFLTKFANIKIVSGNSFDEIHLLDGSIQYVRSAQIGTVITSGRIAIATTDLDGNRNYDSYPEVEKLYRSLRNWLKKRSTNKLVCFNEKIGRNSMKPVKNIWLCEGAAQKIERENLQLKQILTAAVVFEPTL